MVGSPAHPPCSGRCTQDSAVWPVMKPSGTLCVPLACDRAMAHYNCEVKAVLGQALISLKSTEERDNIVGICIITEVSLSPATPVTFLPFQVSDSFVRCPCCWKCFFMSNSRSWCGVDGFLGRCGFQVG